MSTVTKEERYPVEELWVDSIGIRPVTYDWGEGWDEIWTARACPECPECGEYARWDDDEREWRCKDHPETEIEEEATGPMMNYHYPLPDLNRFQASYDRPVDEERVVERIADLPLCLVRWEETGGYSLALTGGGMDLSWEICEAFTRLGYLPPIHFADLPRMSGYPRDDDDRYVIAACKRSAEVAAHQASRTLEALTALEQDEGGVER